jgi:hypothetical protein
MRKTLRRGKHLVQLVLCTLLLFSGTLTVQAATYYVAMTGNDAQACATAQNVTTPKRTIASGVGCLNPGDTLYIRSGTWTESIDTGTKVGTAGSYITIAAYPGETVTLQPPSSPSCKYAIVPRSMSYIVFDGLTWDGINGCPEPYGMRIVDGTHHFVIQNMEFKNGQYNGIYVGNADSVTIRNNKIHDQISPAGVPGTRYYGIYFHHGTNSVIEGNDIYNNPGGGIHAYPGPISNLVIRNNKLHHNNNLATSNVEGILVFEGGGTPISGVQIYNNLIYMNGINQPDPGTSGGVRVSNGPDGTKIWNNTIYGNKNWGINVQAGTNPPTNTVIQNNIVHENTSGPITNAGIGSVIDHNITTNPNLVNAAAFNFNLQTGSPAIDAGVFLSQVPRDYRYNPRPQGFTHDIGAYEGSSASTSLSPPMNLRVQ